MCTKGDSRGRGGLLTAYEFIRISWFGGEWGLGSSSEQRPTESLMRGGWRRKREGNKREEGVSSRLGKTMCP